MERDASSYGSAIQAAIADMLRAERAVQDITLDELAARSGMPKGTLFRYLKGQRDIPITALAAICSAFGVPMKTIIDRAERHLESQELRERESE